METAPSLSSLHVEGSDPGTHGDDFIIVDVHPRMAKTLPAEEIGDLIRVPAKAARVTKPAMADSAAL